MHPLVALVKQAVEVFVKKGDVIGTPEELSAEMLQKAGVFVCLKKGGQLRGCIGTIEPAASCVAEEAIRNAVASASQDPRFLPVGEHELEGLDYSVDVLCPPVPVRDIAELDPSRFGVIVSKGTRRGLLLPDLEGVGTVQRQIEIARMKAGIGRDENDVQIFFFEVKRFK